MIFLWLKKKKNPQTYTIQPCQAAIAQILFLFPFLTVSAFLLFFKECNS